MQKDKNIFIKKKNNAPWVFLLTQHMVDYIYVCAEWEREKEWKNMEKITFILYLNIKIKLDEYFSYLFKNHFLPYILAKCIKETE